MKDFAVVFRDGSHLEFPAVKWVTENEFLLVQAEDKQCVFMLDAVMYWSMDAKVTRSEP